ncbi:MAG: cytochrome P450 [Actinobacteria bacterium]|nr:cytochrome P450 [Actinomycetota bacterium]MCL5444728.1 cytochrome P450 [Actinomycetota bacterium]
MNSFEFNPFSEEFFNDPYDAYRRMRDEAPVYHSKRYGFYALSRFDDVRQAHLDWETFTSTHGVDLSMLTKTDPVPPSIIMMDPPQHNRLRALVNRVFTPRAMNELEPMVHSTISSYMDSVGDRRDFDILEEVAAPFPVEVISKMLGIPAADRQTIRHWLDLGLHREPGMLEPTKEGYAAMVEMWSYFYELVLTKRRSPTDDMLTALTRAEVERDDGEVTKLDDVEVAAFATLLGAAGAETVTKLVGNAVVLFSRHQDEWNKILRAPQCIPSAVNEVLRFWPPSQYQGRFSTKRSTFHGVEIPEGVPVLLITGAATRDEREFNDPDKFDIDRPPGLSLGFGTGVHTCLGAALARLESRIAIEEISQRWPVYDVDEDGLRRVQMSNVAGYCNVPVRIP